MSLEERSDKLDKKMDIQPPEQTIESLLRDIHRRDVQLRIVIIVVVMNIMLNIFIGYGIYRMNQLIHPSAESTNMQDVIELN